MLESEDEIAIILDTLGENLEFDFGLVKGIPEQVVYSVQGLNSIYDIEKQDTSFYINYLDFYQHKIEVKDRFMYLIRDAEYTFEVTSYSVMLDGWVVLKVNLLGLN
jgi:hypothetical protein